MNISINIKWSWNHIINLLSITTKKKIYEQDKLKYPTIYGREPKLPDRPAYFFITSIYYGLFEFAIYIIPITFPLAFWKELYRLEIKFRNINDEKNERYYNELI